MTLKLTVVLRLSGRIQAEGLDQLREHVSSHRPNVLDLAEVMLVDVAVIRFLIACQAAGIALINCSRYIHKWMDRERREGNRE